MNHPVDHQHTLPDAPGPTGCPLVGSLPALSLGILRFFEKINARYGGTAVYKLGKKHVYLITHPEDLAKLFKEERRGAYVRKFFHPAYCPAFGNGIFNSYGNDWKRQREILQPLFQKKVMASWFPIIYDETEQLIDRLPQPVGGQSIQAEQVILPLVQAIMSRILFGQPLQDEDSKAAVDAIQTVSQQTVTRSLLAFIGNGILNRVPTPGNRRYQQALKTIDRTIAQLREKIVQSGDSTSLLAKMAPHFDHIELRDHCFTLFFAGQDTSVNALAFTLYYLGKYPDIQQRTRDEIDAVFANKGALNFADLKQLRYLDSVIAESMRLSPPAYAGYRDVVGDQTLRDYTIRDDALLVFSPYMTHRHPDFWEDPDSFNPERFFNPPKPRDPLAFFPYGGGMRTCIGLNLARVEILTIIALILHACRWTIPAHYQLKFTTAMTLHAKKGIPLKISKRQ